MARALASRGAELSVRTSCVVGASSGSSSAASVSSSDAPTIVLIATKLAFQSLDIAPPS